MKNVYFLSDAHLGSLAIPHGRMQERRLVRFLDSIKEKAAAIYLLGDMFDFWYEYKYVVPKGYTRFANDGSFEDPYWEDIVRLGTARSETITNHYLKAGYLESISGAEGAIYVDWGVSRDYPQSCGPIYVNKELGGFVSLLFMDPALKDDACRLNKSIFKKLLIVLFSL